MRRIEMENGVVIYEKEAADYEQEALLRLAQMQAEALEDETAVQVAGLFPLWQPGVAYEPGQRICDGQGRLYRVAQAHTSQADWTLGEATALYVALGVTTAEPEAVPAWVQPVGAHDAYQVGDRVRYEEAVYVSLIDGNIWPPDGTFWALV